MIFPCCWPLFKSSITLLIEHQSLSMGGSSGRELLNNLRRDRLQKLSYETQNSCNSLLVRYFKRMKATCRGFSAQYMGLQLSIIPTGQRFCHRGTLLQIILPVRSNIAKLSGSQIRSWVALSLLVGCSVVRPSGSVTSPLISTIWCFTPYKPYMMHVLWCLVVSGPCLMVSGGVWSMSGGVWSSSGDVNGYRLI